MVRGGGRAAFDEIVRRHRPSLIAFAGTLAPQSRAEDVVQDSLLKAYSALQEGAQPELLRAWLFRIVRNTAIDAQRGVRHHEELDENYDGVEQPPQALERRERLATLVAAIGDLPRAQREAIIKRELEGRGHEEIGDALDLSPGAVRQLIFRARHALRETAGTMIPIALVRAASLPGTEDAIGGLSMAGAVKVGLAAIVATGTIAAGTSIQHHDGGAGEAQAREIATPGDRSTSRASDFAAKARARSDDRRGGDDRSGDRADRDHRGSGRDGRSRGSGGTSGTSGTSGSAEHSGSGEEGISSNSGPGSSGSGSGSSGSDGGSLSGGGSSGRDGGATSGGGMTSGAETSGSGSGSGSSGSGSDDGGMLLGTSDSTSHRGPG